MTKRAGLNGLIPYAHLDVEELRKNFMDPSERYLMLGKAHDGGDGDIVVCLRHWLVAIYHDPIIMSWNEKG